MVGYAQRPVTAALDEVNRTAQTEPARQRDRRFDARRVSLRAVAESKGQFEPFGIPSFAILGHPANPFTQIGLDRIDAVVPYALDRRRKVFVITSSDLRQRAVERSIRLIELVARQRQMAGGSQRCQQLELDLVEKRTARERVDNLDSLDLLARLEPMNRLEKEPVRTRREILQRGGRVGTRIDLMARQCGALRR